MKYTIIATLVAVALLLVGCGKSDVQKKLETELNDQIAKLHDAGMSTYNQAKELTGQIEAAIAMHDSLGKKHAKQFEAHSSADLVAAKDKIVAAVASMDTWMKEFKPYDPEQPHEQVLLSLNKAKDDAMTMKTALENAVNEASSSLAAHKAFAEEALKKFKK